MKTAILTISTSVAAGRTEDTSGACAGQAAEAAGAEIVATRGRARRPGGDRGRGCARYADRRRDLADLHHRRHRIHPDDVTPEATRAVIDRDAPGFAEAMRAESLRHTPMGILTRGVSGIAGRTLIINFPGNPKAIGELFPVIAPTLRHGTLSRDAGSASGGGHDTAGRPLSCAG